MRTVDAYVRVSRVGGRSGESFISPDEQRATIDRWASSARVTIAEWHEDLDQSGGTLDRPGFNAALGRCRAGLTGGIVAAKLDRLTRSVVGLGALLEDAETHGFNLVALDLGLDLGTSNGKLVANVLGSVAEWERDRRRDDWDAARRNAIARGVPNGRAPYGYRKRPDGRLELDEEQARHVQDAFRRRAAGEPFAAIGRSYGWSHSTARQILSSDAYLGVARAGGYVNEHAHTPIVTRDEYDAAQVGRTLRAAAPGTTTGGRLVKGLARCAGCGRTLKVVRRPRADGSYVVAYFCKNAASSPCPERAYVHADVLDRFVMDWFTAAIETAPRMVDVVAASRELEAATAELDDANRQLYGFVEQADALDAALFRRGLAARETRVTEARDRVRELTAHRTRLPAGGLLSDVWAELDVDERRAVLAGFLGTIVVSRGASADLVDHVRIAWSDGSLAFPEIADDEHRVRVAAA